MRKGDWKIHFEIPIWDEGEEHCGSGVICECAGSRVLSLSSPLLYHISSDHGERMPIDQNDPIYIKIVPNLVAEKEIFLEKINKESADVVNQLDYSIPLPWLMPCCNPPSCSCVEPPSPDNPFLDNPFFLR